MELTFAQAMRDFVASAGSATKQEIERAIETAHPNRWRPGTYRGHIYGCVINNPKAYEHHPFMEKFLFRTDDDKYEIYSEKLHGPNKWEPDFVEEINGIEELAETSISLELVSKPS